MKKSMVWVIFGLILFFTSLGGFFACKIATLKKLMPTFAPPPPVVSVVTAIPGVWQPVLSAIGSLSAVKGVDVAPETSGHVRRLFFKSGDHVNAGDPLIQLDDASEQAQLRSAQAQLHLTQTNYQRTKSLFEQKAAAQATLDDSRSALKQWQANVDNISSLIAKKLVRAPFNGRIGINQISLGQYITAGQICASLQTTNALYVKFSLAQKDLSKINLKQKVAVQVDTYPEKTFQGFVSAIDSKLDENTRMIEVQATVDNSERKLFPGMFVNVKLDLPVLEHTISLPQEAVTYTLYGESAYIVKSKENTTDGAKRPMATVHRIFIRTGDKQGDKALILEGIQAGDRVVVSGQLKLDDGMTVVLDK